MSMSIPVKEFHTSYSFVYLGTASQRDKVTQLEQQSIRKDTKILNRSTG